MTICSYDPATSLPRWKSPRSPPAEAVGLTDRGEIAAGIAVEHEAYRQRSGRIVAFEDADPAAADAIDAAYRTKYRHHGEQYVNSVTDSVARSTTIRIIPR